MIQSTKKDTILFSVGPHQVITQYVLSIQKKLDKKIIAVLRTSTTTDGAVLDKGLIECEEYVNGILDLGQIIFLESIYRLWGKNKLEKLIGIPFLKMRIRALLSETRINPDKVENVILSARFDLGEILLLSVFQNLKKVYFVSDGNPNMYTNKLKYKLPFYLNLLGYKNPYKQIPKVFFHTDNLPEISYNIIPEVLDDNISNSVMALFFADKYFSNWLTNTFGDNNKVNKSLIFLQPLEVYIDFKINNEIYLRIIRLELKKISNTIIIKHHPRQGKESLKRFKINVKAEFGDKVRFFDDSFLARLPVEIYLKDININRVITMYSSAVLFAKNAEIMYYSSELLPKKYIETTEKLAGRYGQVVNYV